MDAQPFDYGSLIRQGQAIVPDFAAEMAKKQLMALQQAQIGLQVQQAQQEQHEAQAFDEDLDGVLANPNADAYARLILRHPKQAEKVKAAWSMLDDSRQKADLTSMGEIYSAAANGRYDLAAASLKRRIEANRKAGHEPDPDDTAMLSMLESGDPEQQKKAVGMGGLILAAITGPDKFAATFGELTKGKEAFTLAPGNKRFDAEGNEIASAPFAPREVKVGEGDTVLEYQPGQVGADGQPTDRGDIWQRLIAQESGGRQFNASGKPLTSNRGAVGVAQVMPETGPEAAKLAGEPWNANRLAMDPAYNEKLGRAYFQKQMQDFGDPALAAAAYNAGPGAVRAALSSGGQDGWLAKLPKETQDYVSNVVGGGGQGSGGGPRIIAQGEPKKPTFRLMTPDENTAQGLDPNVRYQINTETGQVTAVGGQEKSQGQLKPVPPAARNLIVSRRDALRQVNTALAALEQNPDAIGYIKGNLPESVVQRTDPKGVTTRAAIGKVSGQIIHDVSGAAVTLSEAPRFRPYIPSLTDTPEAAKDKLRQLRALLDSELGDFSATYGPENGYKGVNLPPVGSSAPVKVRSIQEAQKLPAGTLFTAPNGQTYRKK